MTQTPQLLQVQILFRHGARTPLHHVQSSSFQEARWTPDMLEDLPHTLFPYQLVDLCSQKPFTYVGNDLVRTYRLPGGSLSGQLIKQGQEQAFQLGQSLKKQYIDDQAFLSRSKTDSELYVRSTLIGRTIKSLRCLLAGLYGEALHEEGSTTPVKVYVDNWNREILFPSPSLDKYGKIYAAGVEAYTASQDHQEMKRLIKLCLGVDRVFDDFDGCSRQGDCPIYYVRDDYVAREVAGFPIPHGLKTLMSNIDTLSSEELKYEFLGYSSDWNHNLNLFMGSVFCLLLSNMKAHDSVPKFHLYSVHDSTLLLLLHSLGMTESGWPPFASYVTFELYYCSQSTSPEDHLPEYLSRSEKDVIHVSSMGEPVSRVLDPAAYGWTAAFCQDLLLKVLYNGTPIPLECIWNLRLSSRVPRGYIPLRILVEKWVDSVKSHFDRAGRNH